jgi:hypothetical protein
MPCLRFTGRVLVTLAGLVLLPVSSTSSGGVRSSLCASETQKCEEEYDSYCYATPAPLLDRVWKAEQ